VIAGAHYIPDYLDQPAHDELLAAVDRHPWQMSVDHGVQVYGYHYNHRLGVAYKIGELPPWAVSLATRLHQDGYVSRIPNQLVANEYQPGAGMFDHVDQAVFGEVVISVSLGSTCIMRFSRPDSDAVHDLLLEPRSVLVLSGDVRWQWKHGIPARTADLWKGRELIRSRRVSLTFRAVPDGTSP